MKILRLMRVMLAQGFYRWAMREIDPMHQDVPGIMVRQSELADEAKAILGEK